MSCPQRSYLSTLFLSLAVAFCGASVNAQDSTADSWSNRSVLVLPEKMPPILDFVFSQDLRDVYFLVGDPNSRRILKNGEVTDKVDHLFFSPLRNGASVTVWATVESDDGHMRDGRLIRNGVVEVEASWVGPPQASSDGSVLAYWKGEGAYFDKSAGYNSGHYTLMHGDKVIAEQETRPGFPLAISPNGKKVAYVLEPKMLQKTLYVGKKELAQAGFILDLHWSADSKKVAYQLGPAAFSSSVHLNGKEIKHKFDKAAVPVLDPKGKKLAFLFRDEHRVGVMAGKKAWKGRWDLLSRPVWSPKGKSLAVIANQGADPILYSAEGFGADWFVKPYSSLMDPDTKGFRLAEKMGDFRLVVDDEEMGGTYLMASDPTWGPDGERVAFRAESAAGWHVVVGEQESEAYDRVTAPLFHPKDGRVGFGAVRGKDVLWVVLPMPEEE